MKKIHESFWVFGCEFFYGRWARTSYKWSYNLPISRVINPTTHLYIRLFISVITLFTTGWGPPYTHLSSIDVDQISQHQSVDSFTSAVFRKWMALAPDVSQKFR